MRIQLHDLGKCLILSKNYIDCIGIGRDKMKSLCILSLRQEQNCISELCTLKRSKNNDLSKSNKHPLVTRLWFLNNISH